MMFRLFNWGGRLPLQPDLPQPMETSNKSAHEPAEFDLRSETSMEEHEWTAVLSPEAVVSLFGNANEAVCRLLARLMAGRMGLEDPTSDTPAPASQIEDPPRVQVYYDGDNARCVKQVREILNENLQKIREQPAEPSAANVLLMSRQLVEGV